MARSLFGIPEDTDIDEEAMKEERRVAI